MTSPRHAGGPPGDSFRIEFTLCPLADISPWGDTLHWFGLTLGWNDVLISGQRLFSCHHDVEPNGVDYQVARRWEDLIAMVPVMMADVPHPLAQRVADPVRWAARLDHASRVPALADLYRTAGSWWFERTLDSGHLNGVLHLHLGRVGDKLHAYWYTKHRPNAPS